MICAGSLLKLPTWLSATCILSEIQLPGDRLGVCVVADFGALRYQTETVLMRAANLDIYSFPRHSV